MKFLGVVLLGVLQLIEQVDFENICLKNCINFFSNVRYKSEFNIFQPFVYRGSIEQASTFGDKNIREGMIQFFGKFQTRIFGNIFGSVMSLV